MQPDNRQRKITRLQVENFKRISVVDITPNGNIVSIVGRNAQGKSSALDAISAVLQGAAAIPPQPVKDGFDKATIICTLEDLIVKRIITAEGKTTLVVQNADGMKFNGPQAVIDKFVGKLTFDPLAFTRMEPKKQLDTLKSLVGLDFTDLENKRATFYGNRTDINRDLKAAEARLSAMPRHPGVPEKEESVAQLMQEFTRLQNVNNDNAEARRKLAESEASLTKSQSDLKAIHGEISRLQALAAEKQEEVEFIEGKLGAERESVAALVDVDLVEIKTRMQNVEATNRKVRENANREKESATVKALSEKVGELTTKIEAVEKQKEDQLKNADFPIAGLAFGDNGILFNSVPFEQASAAEQLKVSVAMAIALNPGIRVMLIRDGSLLDSDSMDVLSRLADEHNMQCWVERVAGDGETGFVIEDGMVQEQSQSV